MGSGVDGGAYRDPGALRALEGAGTVSVARALARALARVARLLRLNQRKKGKKEGDAPRLLPCSSWPLVLVCWSSCVTGFSGYFILVGHATGLLACLAGTLDGCR